MRALPITIDSWDYYSRRSVSMTIAGRLGKPELIAGLPELIFELLEPDPILLLLEFDSCEFRVHVSDFLQEVAHLRQLVLHRRQLVLQLIDRRVPLTNPLPIFVHPMFNTLQDKRRKDGHYQSMRRC